MLTPDEQRRTWEGYYLADWRSNYYADLATTRRSRNSVLSWTALFLSSGALVSVFAHAPIWAMALSLLSASLTLYMHVTEQAKCGAECAEMADRQNRLAMDYERLWGSMYENDAPSRLAGLEERRAQLSRDAMRLPVDNRRLLKWQDYVDQQRGIRAAA